jgi:hypothetical protein
LRAPSRLTNGSSIESPTAPRIRLAQAVLQPEGPKPSDTAAPVGEPNPAVGDVKPSADSKPSVDAKPTFADVEQATRMIRSAPSPDLQLDPNVPLDKAVVAKQNVFLRSAATSAARAVAVVPAGQLLEVIGTSSDRAWIQVRHKMYGTGYVSGDYVEAALVKLSKAVSFDANAFELSEKAKAELAASFGALGGVLVVDAAIDYSVNEAAIGFARATLASEFIENLAVPARVSSNAPRLFISVRPVTPDKIEPNTIRATILCLPLDQKTRTALAQVFRSGQPVVLDLNDAAVEPAGSLAHPDLKYCNLTGADCKRPEPDKGAPNTVLNAVRDNTKDGGILSAPVTDAVKSVQGLIKF